MKFQKGNTAAKGRRSPPRIATLLARVEARLAEIQRRLDIEQQQDKAQ